MREVIFSDKTPKSVGPYSDAVRVGNLLFVGGKDTRDPKNGEIVRTGIEDETRTCMNNIKAAVESGGSSMSQLVKVTVYLADIRDFDSFNKIYGEFFPDPKNVPTRAALEAKLWGGISVELEAIAYVEED